MPLRNGVVKLQRLLEGRVGQHVQDRSERLTPHDVALLGHADLRWAHVVAFGRRGLDPLAAHYHGPALRDGLLQRGLHRVEGLPVDEWADKGGFREGVPYGEPR